MFRTLLVALWALRHQSPVDLSCANLAHPLPQSSPGHPSTWPDVSWPRCPTSLRWPLFAQRGSNPPDDPGLCFGSQLPAHTASPSLPSSPSTTRRKPIPSLLFSLHSGRGSSSSAPEAALGAPDLESSSSPHTLSSRSLDSLSWNTQLSLRIPPVPISNRAERTHKVPRAWLALFQDVKPQPPSPPGQAHRVTTSRHSPPRPLLTPSVHTARMPLPTGLRPQSPTSGGWNAPSSRPHLLWAPTPFRLPSYARPTWDRNLEYISCKCWLLLYLGWKFPRSRHHVLWIRYPGTHLLMQPRGPLREDSSSRSSDAAQCERTAASAQPPLQSSGSGAERRSCDCMSFRVFEKHKHWYNIFYSPMLKIKTGEGRIGSLWYTHTHTQSTGP